jgi:hypothetical protein
MIQMRVCFFIEYIKAFINFDNYSSSMDEPLAASRKPLFR